MDAKGLRPDWPSPTSRGKMQTWSLTTGAGEVPVTIRKTVADKGIVCVASLNDGDAV